MTTAKADFLKTIFPQLLGTIDPATPPLWGKMNPQQMIEHMSDSFRIANGKDVKVCVTPEEHVSKMQSFLLSDKPFKENTPNPQLPDVPPATRFEQVQDAILELQGEIDDFFLVFEGDSRKIITNPFFGDLDAAMWIQLLYKHSLHHLRQFGVVPEPFV